MPKLVFKSVRTGKSLDELILDGEGRLHTKNRMAREMITPFLASGMSPEEVFDHFNGWSNGYVQSLTSTPRKE